MKLLECVEVYAISELHDPQSHSDGVHCFRTEQKLVPLIVLRVALVFAAIRTLSRL
jgi:hypothetical protein